MRLSDQNGFDMAAAAQNACFDGRAIMPPNQRIRSSAAIGRNLSSIYPVPTDRAEALERALREIERKITS